MTNELVAALLVGLAPVLVAQGAQLCFEGVQNGVVLVHVQPSDPQTLIESKEGRNAAMRTPTPKGSGTLQTPS
jgi:hypothetical protein